MTREISESILQKDTSAKKLSDLIKKSEDWLMERILNYAKERGYTKYTSTLIEAWRLSVAGLSESLINTLAEEDLDLELHPDEDYSKDPAASFGVLEAKLHRERGISLGMFLGLMKYYRQTYMDLVRQSDFDTEYKRQCFALVERFFDRVELGFCTEWASSAESKLIEELQSTNRFMTNEKNKYLTAFESLPHPIIMVDKDNRIENMNHAAGWLFRNSGVPGAEYYQMPGDNGETNREQENSELVSDLIPWLSEEFDRFINSKVKRERFEKAIETPEGKTHVDVRLARMLDASGKFSGCVIILEVISERKLAEDRLRISNQFLQITNRHRELQPLLEEFVEEVRNLCDCEAVAIRVLDEDGNIPYAVYDGFSKGFIKTESPLSIKTDKCMCINVITGAIEPGPSFCTDRGSFYINGTTSFLATISGEEKGSTRNVCNQSGYESVALIPMRSGDKIVGLIHLADSRENKIPLTLVETLEVAALHLGAALVRVQTEEALLTSERRLALAIEASGAGIYDYRRPLGKGVYHSKRLMSILGYTKEEIPRGSDVVLWLESLIHPNDFNQFDKAYTDFLEGRTPKFEGELRMKHKSGKWINIQGHAEAAERDKSGRVNQVVGVMLDITKRKRLEKRLLESRKMDAIADLAGGIAHEFNNSLTGLFGNLELLQINAPSDADINRYIDRIKVPSHRMAQLTNQLLAYARGGRYESQTISVRDFIEESLAIIRHSIDPGIKTEISFSKRALYFSGDPTQIQMTLAAIIENSKEAMEGKGRIRIIAREEVVEAEPTEGEFELIPGAYICLAIEDDGKGMDEETKEKVFEPFFTTKFQGRGLGMAAVYGIIKSHNGAVFVDSDLGKGTTVRIYLPAVKA